MSEQTVTNGNGINIEALVSQRDHEDFDPIEVDILTLVKSVTHNVTLLKEVWAKPVFGELNIFAAFGLPEDKRWLVTLVAEE